MIEPLRTPSLNQNITPQELRNYIYTTIQALNLVLLDIDKRINELEKGEKK